MAVTDTINIATAADIPFACSHVNNQVLAASVAKTLTVPTGADCVLLNYTADTWVRVGGAATVPAADIVDGTGMQLNPTGLKGIQGKTISVISASVCIVSQAYYPDRGLMAGENRKRGTKHTGLQKTEDGVARSVYSSDGRKVGELKSRGFGKNHTPQQLAYMKKKGLTPSTLDR